MELELTPRSEPMSPLILPSQNLDSEVVSQSEDNACRVSAVVLSAVQDLTAAMLEQTNAVREAMKHNSKGADRYIVILKPGSMSEPKSVQENEKSEEKTASSGFAHHFLKITLRVVSVAAGIGLVGTYLYMPNKDKDAVRTAVKNAGSKLWVAGSSLNTVGSLFWVNGSRLAKIAIGYCPPISSFFNKK